MSLEESFSFRLYDSILSIFFLLFYSFYNDSKALHMSVPTYVLEIQQTIPETDSVITQLFDGERHIR